MVKLEDFLQGVRDIEATHPKYKLGRSGADGYCDCIGLIIGAIRRAGGKWNYMHGSNYAARNQMATFSRISKAADLQVGDAVYKVRKPGESGYNLPARYSSHADQNDYLHVGIVTGVNPLEITHCTSPGVIRDTKLGRWRYHGRLKLVDYEGGSAEIPSASAADAAADAWMTATVTAKSGGTVRLRSAPSRDNRLYWLVPVGSTIQVGADRGDGWTPARWGRYSGYMMTEFIRRE